MASKPRSRKSRAPARSARKPRRPSASGAKAQADAVAPLTGHSIRLTAALTPEGGGYVARCLEVEVASQGDTIEDALAHLRAALELYFEDAEAPPPAAPPLIAPIELML